MKQAQFWNKFERRFEMKTNIVPSSILSKFFSRKMPIFATMLTKINFFDNIVELNFLVFCLFPYSKVDFFKSRETLISASRNYSYQALNSYPGEGHPMLKILCFSKSQISEILRFSIVESHSLSLFSAKNRECLHFPTSPILRFSSEFLPFYFSFHFFHFLIALEAFKNSKTHTFSTLLCFLSRNDVVLRPFQPTNSPTC